MTPKSLVAYVGSYRGPDGAGGGIDVFDVSSDGRQLTALSRVDEPNEAGYLAYAPAWSTLYAVDERKTDGRGPVEPPAAVHAFAVDQRDGRLSWLNSRLAPGPRPTFLSVDEVSRVVVTANHGDFDHVEHVVPTEDGGWTVDYLYDDSTVIVYDVEPDGRLGEIRDVQVLSGHGPDPNGSPQAGGHGQARAHAHWLTDEAAPMTWRLDKSMAGAGALGDLGSHIIDAVQFVTGQLLTSVAGLTRTFVPERPLPGGGAGLVTVDDATAFLGALSGGSLATFAATRMAAGRKNALRLEVSGSAGAVAFDLDDLNCLQYYRADEGPTAGFRRILVTEPEHPYVAAWWPPGHALGYEHAFSHQVADLVVALSKSEQPQPSFDDGYQVQRVLDAVERSSSSQRWEPVVPGTGTASAG